MVVEEIPEGWRNSDDIFKKRLITQEVAYEDAMNRTWYFMPTSLPYISRNATIVLVDEAVLLPSES